MKLSVIAFRIKELIKYYLRADTIYNIHSPLVYNLTEHIFKKEVDKNSIRCIEKIRKQCLNDKNSFAIVDHGAGSAVKSKNHAHSSPNSIINSAVSPQNKCRLLYLIAQFFNPDKVLELGTSLGIATLYLSHAVPESAIYTIEGDETIANFASRHFDLCRANNITLVRAKIDDVLTTLLNKHPNIKLVFIDANHNYEATIKYFQGIIKALKRDIVLIFDDIYWSQGMKQAWEEIKNDERVSITIDLYQLGIVIIRPGLSKQNFTLIDYKLKPFRFGIFASEIKN